MRIIWLATEKLRKWQSKLREKDKRKRHITQMKVILVKNLIAKKEYHDSGNKIMEIYLDIIL